jgi:signal transduction histidine kinase
VSFRTKLLVACLALALVPLALFGVGARRDVTGRLEAEYAGRVAALADEIGAEIERESESISERLGRVSEAMKADTRLRLELLGAGGDAAERAYLLDYALRAMPLAGLDLLRIQSANGQVLSSGHFRNEYGALDPALASALGRSPDRAVLAELATPSGSMLALSRGVPLEVGAETFTVIGGTAVDDAFIRRLEGGTGLDVALLTTGVTGDGPAAPSGPRAPAESATDARPAAAGSELVREVELPFVSAGAESVARFVVRASDAPLVALRRELDRWLLGAAVVAALLAVLLAALASTQLSSPLAALARRAGRIDLDRLDVSFGTRRLDEIGDLSRVLDRMTARLRASASRLRDAERRATTGDIARQVHHDVRNGLIPIRNVLGHLAQVSRESPDRLRDVFLERQGTLDSSVAYLQSLASNYARMSPAVERRPCDVSRIAGEVVADAAIPRRADAEQQRRSPTHGVVGVRVESDLSPGLPPVLADPVALRRVLDNLVMNAVESLGAPADGQVGRVLVWTRLARADGAGPRVQLGVSDTGRGMSSEERAHMFDDFYTTKAHGTGLGLSIVRRLVSDMGGRIEVESAPGEGTRITVELPPAAGGGATQDVHAAFDDVATVVRTADDAIPVEREPESSGTPERAR